MILNYTEKYNQLIDLLIDEEIEQAITLYQQFSNKARFKIVFNIHVLFRILNSDVSISSKSKSDDRFLNNFKHSLKQQLEDEFPLPQIGTEIDTFLIKIAILLANKNYHATVKLYCQFMDLDLKLNAIEVNTKMLDLEQALLGYGKFNHDSAFLFLFVNTLLEKVPFVSPKNNLDSEKTGKVSKNNTETSKKDIHKSKSKVIHQKPLTIPPLRDLIPTLFLLSIFVLSTIIFLVEQLTYDFDDVSYHLFELSIIFTLFATAVPITYALQGKIHWAQILKVSLLTTALPFITLTGIMFAMYSALFAPFLFVMSILNIVYTLYTSKSLTSSVFCSYQFFEVNCLFQILLVHIVMIFYFYITYTCREKVENHAFLLVSFLERKLENLKKRVVNSNSL